MRISVRTAFVTVGAMWAGAVMMVSAAQSPSGSGGWHIGPDAGSIASPVATNAGVIAKGKTLFQAKCARCHGADGAGGGPDADFAHRPTDLRDARRALLNPDGVLFYKIWNGRAKPRMPAMKSDLTANDVWMLVQYVKTLRQ